MKDSDLDFDFPMLVETRRKPRTMFRLSAVRGIGGVIALKAYGIREPQPPFHKHEMLSAETRTQWLSNLKKL